jgi:hypothetical protein
MDNTLLSDFLNFDIYQLQNNADNLEIIHDNNARHTLILMTSKDKEQLDFLGKILKAVQYDITQDVLLISLPQETQIDLTKMMRDVDISRVILFGIPLKDIGIHYNLPNYRPVTINSKTFLLAEKLGQISNNQLKKKDLWNALQKVFL